MTDQKLPLPSAVSYVMYFYNVTEEMAHQLYADEIDAAERLFHLGVFPITGEDNVSKMD